MMGVFNWWIPLALSLAILACGMMLGWMLRGRLS